MAKKSVVDPLVMAYDENGQLVPTPESETVNIPVCPQPRDKSGKRLASKDGGTPITPRVARFLARDDARQPDCLVSMERVPAEKYGYEYWYVKVGFRTPFVRYVLDGKTYTGNTSGVCVFNEQDARDPYFAKLSAEERATILSRLNVH